MNRPSEPGVEDPEQRTPPFQRVAIVNRGAPAIRFINAVAELNRAGARLTIDGTRVAVIESVASPTRALTAWCA